MEVAARKRAALFHTNASWHNESMECGEDVDAMPGLRHREADHTGRPERVVRLLIQTAISRS